MLAYIHITNTATIQTLEAARKIEPTPWL